MTERRMIHLLLTCCERDEHVHDFEQALDAGRSSEGEVAQEAGLAFEDWSELEQIVAAKRRDAHKRLMVHRTKAAA